MPQPRYFGMTVLQIASLAVMAVLNFSVLIVGAVVVTADEGPFSMPQLAQRLPTPIPRPSPTPLPTATPKFTPTPVPGWEMFAGGGAELWLPASYVGGDPATDLVTITAQLQASRSNFNQIVEAEQQLTQTVYALFAFDTDVGKAVSPTTVQVSQESLKSNPAITLDEYLNSLVQKLPPDARLVDRRMETLDDYRAGRLFVEYRFTDLGLDVFRKRAIYAIRVRNTMWVVQYLTERDSFQEHLPVFDLSIRTFRVR